MEEVYIPQMSPMYWVVFPVVMMLLVMIVGVIMGSWDSVSISSGGEGKVLLVVSKQW